MKLAKIEAKIEKTLLSRYETEAADKMNPYLAKGMLYVGETGLLGLIGGMLTACFTTGMVASAAVLGVMPIGLGLMLTSYAAYSYVTYKGAQKDIAEDIKNGAYQESFLQNLKRHEKHVTPEDKPAFDEMVAGIAAKFDYAAALKKATKNPVTIVTAFAKAAARTTKGKSLELGKVFAKKGMKVVDVAKKSGIAAGRAVKGKSLDLVNKIKKIIK